MSFRRVSSVLGKVLLLTLLVSIVPACKKKIDPAPHLTRAVPPFDAAGVSHFPLILLEFDKAIDETTIGANVAIFLTDITGMPTVPWGGNYSFIYLPGSFQLVINNTDALGDAVTPTEYAVLISSGLLSSKGDPINGGLALRFFVGTNANLNKPAFGVPTQALGGNTGEIIWNWGQATEGGPIAATYDFYKAPGIDEEDLLEKIPFFTSSLNTGDTILAAKGLVSGTTYHFRVICRDTAGNISLTDDFSGVAR